MVFVAYFFGFLFAVPARFSTSYLLARRFVVAPPPPPCFDRSGVVANCSLCPGRLVGRRRFSLAPALLIRSITDLPVASEHKAASRIVSEGAEQLHEQRRLVLACTPRAETRPVAAKPFVAAISNIFISTHDGASRFRFREPIYSVVQ